MNILDFLPEDLEIFPRKPVEIRYQDGSSVQINDLIKLPDERHVSVVDMFELGGTKGILILYGHLVTCFSFTSQNISVVKRAETFSHYPATAEIIRSADAGEVNAMFHLSQLFHFGNGVSQNIEFRNKLYFLAADLGHASAAYLIGKEKTSATESYPWYLRAAELGHVSAMDEVANLLISGLAIEKDKITGYFWRSHTNGLYKLGVLWEKKLDERIAEIRKSPVDCDRQAVFDQAMSILNTKAQRKDILLAVELLEISASAGHGPAQIELAEQYSRGHLVRKNIDAVRYFLLQVEKSDDGAALGKLAQRYFDGHEVEKNISRAFELWQRSTELGDCDAQYALGHQYQSGEHIEKNLELAFQLFVQAAKKKHIPASYRMALCMENGLGVETDVEKAIFHLQQGIDQNYGPAFVRMAELYEVGEYVEKNLKKAFSLYKIAADVHGISQAFFKVAYMYEHGLGVAQQYKEALEYYDYDTYHQGCSESAYRGGLMHKMGLGTMESLSYARLFFDGAAADGHTDAKREMELLATPAAYEIESKYSGHLRDLFFAIEKYDAKALWEDVILKHWPRLGEAREYYLELRNRKCAYKPWPPVSRYDLWTLFYTMRANEILIYSLHPSRFRYRKHNVSLERYVALFEHIGFDIHWPLAFHTFDCEVVEIEQTEDETIEITKIFWPAIMLGNMMFSRAGVSVRAPKHLLTKGIAESHCLYWTYERESRSKSFHENSNDWIAFRRDFDLGDRYAYNVDGGGSIETFDLCNPFDGDFVDSDLTVEQRIDLLRYRCIVNMERNQYQDFWPFYDYYEEPKSSLI
ncbi:tetratricopeptide repeat protein [Undibacterium sp. Di26W]|uniref:tetratricopeptide repeat protein n=1 Tax=Undibacterium sp. Di26W TaxID=3413035 RepID=UPI003BEFE911